MGWVQIWYLLACSTLSDFIYFWKVVKIVRCPVCLVIEISADSWIPNVTGTLSGRPKPTIGSWPDKTVRQKMTIRWLLFRVTTQMKCIYTERVISSFSERHRWKTILLSLWWQSIRNQFVLDLNCIFSYVCQFPDQILDSKFINTWIAEVMNCKSDFNF